MSKSIIIKNPKPKNHVIYLRSNQTIQLVLRKTNVSPVVTVPHPLVLVEIRERANDLAYDISYNEGLTTWPLWSDYFLGEILINSEFGLVRLSIVLKSNVHEANVHKSSDRLSVVMPKNCRIKIHPQTMLEVILFSDREASDRWNYRWLPANKWLDFKLLSSQYREKHYNAVCNLILGQENVHDGWMHFLFKFEDFVTEMIRIRPDVFTDVLAGRMEIRQGTEVCWLDLYVDTKHLHSKNVDLVTDTNFRNTKRLPLVREIGIKKLDFKTLDEGCVNDLKKDRPRIVSESFDCE